MSIVLLGSALSELYAYDVFATYAFSALLCFALLCFLSARGNQHLISTIVQSPYIFYFVCKNQQLNSKRLSHLLHYIFHKKKKKIKNNIEKVLEEKDKKNYFLKYIIQLQVTDCCKLYCISTYTRSTI